MHCTWMCSSLILFTLTILIIIPDTYAQMSELHSSTISVTLNDADTYSTHNMVVSCSDSVLVYGINLIIQHNDAADRYAIHENTIRLGAHTLQHTTYISNNHNTDVLLFGEVITDLRYPLLIPKYTSLIIPVQVHDDTPGKPAKAVLDITYVSDPEVQCTQVGLYGPQRIGFLDNVNPNSVHIDRQRLEAINLSVDDYNEYLKDLGEEWWIDVVIKDNNSDTEVSLIKTREFHDEGIDIIIGPSASSSVAAVYDYTKRNDMLLISCCSTAPSLAIPDHIFRMAPDDTNQAQALAAVMTDDGIDTVVTIYRDDTYGQGLSDELVNAMEQRGGIVASTIHFSPNVEDLDATSLVARLASVVQDLSEVNGSDRVAVVAISFTEITDIVEAALDYPVLSQVRWYGSESVVNLRDMTEGELGVFSNTVNLSGVIQHVSPNPLNTQIESKIRMQLDLLEDESVNIFAYTAYDAILVLGNAMLTTQSSQTDSLIDALPHVSMKTFGASNSVQFNENGDLAAVDYGIWRVMDEHWSLVGIYTQSSDTITGLS